MSNMSVFFVVQINITVFVKIYYIDWNTIISNYGVVLVVFPSSDKACFKIPPAAVNEGSSLRTANWYVCTIYCITSHNSKLIPNLILLVNTPILLRNDGCCRGVFCKRWDQVLIYKSFACTIKPPLRDVPVLLQQCLLFGGKFEAH